MASVLLTSTISRSRPTKLVLGAGRLCLPATVVPPAGDLQGCRRKASPSLSRRADGGSSRQARVPSPLKGHRVVARIGRGRARVDPIGREGASGMRAPPRGWAPRQSPS